VTRILPNTEKHLAEQVALYLQSLGLLYRFDIAADLVLTIGQAKRNKLLHPRRGFPDLIIYKACGGFHALVVELKREGEKIYKKDGLTPVTTHIAEQLEFLEDLDAEGYEAHMVVGFQEFKQVVDSYLKSSL